MQNNKIALKEKVRTLFNIIGQHINRHNMLLIIYLLVTLFAGIGNLIGWYLSPDEVPQATEITFYVAQGLLLAVTAAGIILLVINKFKPFNALFLACADHLYALFLVAWATLAFCLDLSLGFSPLSYLIIATFIAGVFIIDPIFFGIVEAISLVIIIIDSYQNKHLFFGGEYFEENIVLFVAFVVLIVIICFKNYRVIHSEYKIERKLRELSYNDELTGLLNERSYIAEVEEIDKKIDHGEDVHFAVILMDVNNLKATNDAYGHRFGCSLVVRCGHTLPTLLKTSKLFHVGGDEFVAIVMGEDLVHFEETMEKFDKAMLYSIVTFEDKELIFSVARGYHIRQEGEHYKDVLQTADKEMYVNKKYLKEKYNMKGR